MLRAHRRAHRAIWRALALIIPAILLIGWFARPLARIDVPQRLDAAGHQDVRQAKP